MSCGLDVGCAMLCYVVLCCAQIRQHKTAEVLSLPWHALTLNHSTQIAWGEAKRTVPIPQASAKSIGHFSSAIPNFSQHSRHQTCSTRPGTCCTAGVSKCLEGNQQSILSQVQVSDIKCRCCIWPMNCRKAVKMHSIIISPTTTLQILPVMCQPPHDRDKHQPMKFPVATDPSGVVCRPKPGTAKLEGTGPGKALFRPQEIVRNHHPKGTEFQNHRTYQKISKPWC